MHRASNGVRLIAVILFTFLTLVSSSPLQFLDNGRVRLGVDLRKGGSIVYLAKSGGPNLINSADLGRQIQMSFYGGPVPFTPNGKQPAKAWAGLGWNPIQTGDYYNHPSKISDYKNDGKTLYLKCVPMQWPLDNEPGECTFEAWIRLEGNTVQVRNRLLNNRSDKTQYPARGQELPAIYTNAPWYRLMSYTGALPFTHAGLTQLTNNPPASTFPWVSFSATENWTALVDSAGWGIGIVEPGCQAMSGGFFGAPGIGGATSSPTGYIAPNFTEILDANIDYRFDYTLVLGFLSDIRRYAYDHVPRPKPPVWTFKHDRSHWYYSNAADTGWPIRGELNVNLEQNDPQLVGPAGFWEASKAKKLTITAAFKCHSPDAQVFWTRFGSPGFSEVNSVWFKTVPDGRMRTYLVDLGSSETYRGVITGLRLDPEPAGAPGDSVRVRSISLR
ncbi:MAG: hypothetical protein ACYC96_06570 [Fimbriimonadaceae bacterium]